MQTNKDLGQYVNAHLMMIKEIWGLVLSLIKKYIATQWTALLIHLVNYSFYLFNAVSHLIRIMLDEYSQILSSIRSDFSSLAALLTNYSYTL